MTSAAEARVADSFVIVECMVWYGVLEGANKCFSEQNYVLSVSCLSGVGLLKDSYKTAPPLLGFSVSLAFSEFNNELG
jgi:hypothetical protein